MATVTALLKPGATRVMGIVNVTQDSFADAVHRGITQAIDFGVELAEQGADIIDVGGESTRPGAARVTQEEEAARVLPVVEALAGAGIAVSVDTVRSSVADKAVRAGALFVNDVSGGLADPRILSVVADSPAAYILQHWHIPFDHRPSGEAALAQVTAELRQRLDLALAAGLPSNRLVLDPGIGFGKTASQNWDLLAHADQVAALGFPVLWGVSRKRFLAEAYDRPTEPWQRDEATAALTTVLAGQRVWAVRTHTVVEHRAAVAVAERLRQAAHLSGGLR